MTKREFIDKQDVINHIFYATNNNGEVVLGKQLRERIEHRHTFTEQDIAKPYLDKLKEKIITNTERFSLSRETHGLGEVEWSEYLIPNYQVVELIDNLLSEQGETE